MSDDQIPAEKQNSQPNSGQSALKNVAAGKIQIGQIVQTIVHLGFPFNSKYSRFAQSLMLGLGLACLLGGFVRLGQDDGGWETRLLVGMGTGVLFLTCLYYGWFWRPNSSDRPAKRQEKNLRRLAIVGMVAIPMLTIGYLLFWQSVPATGTTLLIADFYSKDPGDYRVTENILQNLRTATKPYSDVRVRVLDRRITEEEGSEVARASGEQRKAAIVIWGNYAVTPTNVQISVHFEVMKLPNDYPDLGKEASGQPRTVAVAELNSFKLQAQLSNEMAYLTRVNASKTWLRTCMRLRSIDAENLQHKSVI